MRFQPTPALLFAASILIFCAFPALAEDDGFTERVVDNLGNHTATEDMNASYNAIENVRSLKFEKIDNIPAPKGVEKNSKKTSNESEAQ